MKYEDIASLAEKELMKRRKDLRAQIFEASLKNALGQLANPMTIREMRRDVARLETALTAKAGKAAPSAGVSGKAAKAVKAKPARKAGKSGAKG